MFWKDLVAATRRIVILTGRDGAYYCLSSSDCVAWLLIQRAGASESELKNQKYALIVIPPYFFLALYPFRPKLHIFTYKSP
jgi:hypothetical protein